MITRGNFSKINSQRQFEKILLERFIKLIKMISGKYITLFQSKDMWKK